MRDESGATAIEYGLITALIGVGLIVILKDVGQTVAGMYADIGRALDGVLHRMNWTLRAAAARSSSR